MASPGTQERLKPIDAMVSPVNFGFEKVEQNIRKGCDGSTAQPLSMSLRGTTFQWYCSPKNRRYETGMKGGARQPLYIFKFYSITERFGQMSGWKIIVIEKLASHE